MAVLEPGWENRCARCGATPAPWEWTARDVRVLPEPRHAEDQEALRLCENCWGDWQDWFNESPDPNRPAPRERRGAQRG